MGWKNEKFSWHASDLYEMGYVKTQEDWENFQEMLCDTVVAYLELTPKHEAKLIEKDRV